MQQHTGSQCRSQRPPPTAAPVRRGNAYGPRRVLSRGCARMRELAEIAAAAASAPSSVETAPRAGTDDPQRRAATGPATAHAGPAAPSPRAAVPNDLAAPTARESLAASGAPPAGSMAPLTVNPATARGQTGARAAAPSDAAAESIDQTLARLAKEAPTVPTHGDGYWIAGCLMVLGLVPDETARAWNHGQRRAAHDDTLDIAKHLGLVDSALDSLYAGEGGALSGANMQAVRKASAALKDLHERERQWADSTAHRLWRHGIMACVVDRNGRVVVVCYAPVRHACAVGEAPYDRARERTAAQLFKALCLDGASRSEDCTYNPGITGEWLRDADSLAPHEFRPKPGESAGSYFERMTIDVDDLKRRAGLWIALGRDATRYSQAIERERTGTDAPVPMLLGGLIPLNAVTLLVAERKTGKSTLMQQFALAVAGGDAEFLGTPIDQVARAGRAVVVLAGEDTREAVLWRLGKMGGGAKVPADLFVIARSEQSLSDTLDDLASFDMCLLIVDPAREYMVGSEDNSDTASAFMSLLRQFADRRGCAVVVTHHPGKSRKPFRTVSDVVAAARGSSVLSDRARVLLGMVRKGGVTRLGIAHSADGERLQTNLSADHVRSDEMCIVFDPQTERSSVIESGRPAAATPTAARGADVDQIASGIIAAIERIRRSGGTVMKTGQRGIYEAGARELATWPRLAIRSGVDRLIAVGALVDDGRDGLKLSEPAGGAEAA